MPSIKNTAADSDQTSAAFKRRFMTRLVAVLIGGMFLDGYILGIMGTVIGTISAELNFSELWEGLIAASALLGILVGSPLGGWLADKFGRKPLFMADMALFCVGSVLQFFVDSAWQLFLVRLLMGIAIGVEYSVGWPLMSEFAPARLRGRLICGHRGRLVRRVHGRVPGGLRADHPDRRGLAGHPGLEHRPRGDLVPRSARPARVAALAVEQGPPATRPAPSLTST